MMVVFLTSYRDSQGRKRCGPDVEAASIEEAASIIRGLIIDGVLVETINAITGERVLFGEPNQAE